MITLSGILSVKTITGRNGSFAVGKLVSPVGEFSVKDTILDQFPEGKYEGEFLISHIYPHTYIMRGSAVVEVRAKLEDSEQDRQDYELFGADLYGEVVMMVDVKLDPTVDRAKFRAQRDRLKELGYKFNAPTQAWVLP